jgi:hypothetical protein
MKGSGEVVRSEKSGKTVLKETFHDVIKLQRITEQKFLFHLPGRRNLATHRIKYSHSDPR